MVNVTLKKIMKSHGVFQWQIAKYLDISEATMCRKMRAEVDPEFRDKVIEAIEALSDTPVNGSVKIGRNSNNVDIEK